MGKEQRTHSSKEEARILAALPELANTYAIALGNVMSQGGSIPQGWMRPLSVYRIYPALGFTGAHMMKWEESGHHLQIDVLKKFGLATTDSRDMGDNHPGLNLAGGLVGTVIVRPEIQAIAPRSFEMHVRSLVALAHENLDIFTLGAANRLTSPNPSTLQKFHMTIKRQLTAALDI